MGMPDRNFYVEFAMRDQQEEKFMILDGEFLAAGILLETDGVSEWTPAQAEEKVREIRGGFEEKREIDDMDLKEGFGLLAIKNLVEQHKLAERQLAENLGVSVYHTIPQHPDRVHI